MSNNKEKKDRTFTLDESKSNLVLGGFFLVFSLILLFVIIPTQIADVDKGFPSPRFFPSACGVLMLFLSVCLLYQGFRKRGKPQKKSETVTFSSKGVVTAVATLVLLIVSVALLNALPYIPVTVVMLFLLMFLLGQRNKFILVGVSVLLPVIIYFFFTYGLKLVLP